MLSSLHSWRILAKANPALGKMELINVPVLKFVFQCAVSRDVSSKSPSLGLDVRGVGLDMSRLSFLSHTQGWERSVPWTDTGNMDGISASEAIPL